MLSLNQKVGLNRPVLNSLFINFYFPKMSEFNPALPSVIKWSVGQNKYDEDGSNPKSLTLFIPKESIAAFAAHMAAMAIDPEKVKSGKIWDYTANEEVEVAGIYLNAKGKTGQFGDFGNLNPVSLIDTPTHQPATSTAPVAVPKGDSLPF